MSKKLYVGNLGYGVTPGDLEGLFAQHGTVESVNIITDRHTGQSKGFAFVEMASGAEAQSAIDALDGLDFEGRALKVNEAKPRPSSPKGGRWDRR